MKRFLILCCAVICLFSCSSDDGIVNNNPFIPNALVQYQLDLGLPLFDNLRFAGGSTYIANGGGVRGFFVFNLSGDQFLAWEASCPNHIPNNCSTMDIQGVLAKCSCEDFEYSLANGQLLNPNEGEANYPMINYRVTKNGDVLSITNN
jgi:nitrite reductase/ring-hydroxylating ferredoxin subunit